MSGAIVNLKSKAAPGIRREIDLGSLDFGNCPVRERCRSVPIASVN
jgi:hypothetical protein